MTDPVVQAFKDNDPRFEELFTKALAAPRAWERFSTPDSEGNTLFGYAYERLRAIPNPPVSDDSEPKELVVEPSRNYENYNELPALTAAEVARDPFWRIIMRLFVAGAMPTGTGPERWAFVEPWGSESYEQILLTQETEAAPMGTTALLYAYEHNASEFEEVFKQIEKDKRRYLTNLLLMNPNSDGERLHTLAIERGDWPLILRLMKLNIRMALDLTLDPARLTQLLRQVSPGTLGGLKVYEPVTEEYVSTIMQGLTQNPIDSDELHYLRFTVTEGSPAANALLVPHKTPRLEEWLQEQTSYLMSSSRIHDVVKAYTWRGDRFVNAYSRRTLTNPLSLMESIRDDGDTKFPLAYQVLDAYDALLKKGMVGPPGADMWLDGVVNHEAIMKVFKDNFAFFCRLNILYPLVNAFRKELNKIIKQSPQLGYDMVVFRGIKEESYHKPGTIGYVTDSYVSTSLNPRIATTFDQGFIYGTRFHQFVYEMTIPAEIPCLYLEGITGIKGESEVLLPHNLMIHAKYESSLKHYPLYADAETSSKMLDYLAEAERHIVRTMKVIGYAPFQEPITVAPAKTLKNTHRKPKTPFIGRNRNNNYTRRRK